MAAGAAAARARATRCLTDASRGKKIGSTAGRARSEPRWRAAAGAGGGAAPSGKRPPPRRRPRRTRFDIHTLIFIEYKNKLLEFRGAAPAPCPRRADRPPSRRVQPPPSARTTKRTLLCTREISSVEND
ncbi:hypothetical protein EVAR_2839_1 [Eumeta japonica]|uniref:Uncharacterized protein n=1 Tax=Eumeta variegata TaxID=151549 RepID=A0A4C1T0R0_EUMVA|nr:hypothetical protein EVAR_2839_1 [Eumeta japonica]